LVRDVTNNAVIAYDATTAFDLCLGKTTRP
jgi:hypothetical protein